MGKNKPAFDRISSLDTGLVWPIGLSITLVSILLPLPRPSFSVNHPYKIELLLAVFLFLFLVKLRRVDQREILVDRSSLIAGKMLAAIAAFVFWSGLSGLWGASLLSVVHHTLLWSLFAIVFLISVDLTRNNFTFFITCFVAVTIVIGFLTIVDYVALPDFSIAELTLRARYAKTAELLATLSPILWVAAIYSRRHRTLLLTCAALSWLTVMLSLSKGAFLAGVIGFLIFFAGAIVAGKNAFRGRLLRSGGVWLALTVTTQVLSLTLLSVPSTTDYLTGSADPSRTSSTARILVWKIAEEMVLDNPALGVGADNFYRSINSSRADFREKNPADTLPEVGEDFFLERAHSEPLQVLAELGPVGLTLFCLPILIFGYYFVRGAISVGSRTSPILWASMGGSVAFLVSSLFSSFSFRAAQNGVVFFMVAAIGVNELSKLNKTHRSTLQPLTTRRYFVCVISIALMIIFGLTKLSAEYHLYSADGSTSMEAANDHFKSATRADPDYAGAYLAWGMRLSSEGENSQAAVLTRRSIDLGLGIPIVYSLLARQQIASGDFSSAENTFRESISIYPRSIFIGAEFAAFLDSQSRINESLAQLDRIRAIDMRQANGWYAIVKLGSSAAYEKARRDPTIALPAELTPYEAVRAYLDGLPIQ